MLVLGLIVTLTSTGWASPLNESFEETLFPPPAWQSLETGDGANLWIRTQNSSWSHTGLALAQSTEEELAGGLVAQRWLITPKLSVASATDSVAFWVRTQYSFVSDNDSLYVLLSTTDSLPASFNVRLDSFKCGSLGDFAEVYVRFAHSLGAYNGQNVFVAFLHRDEGDDGNRLYFDDVSGPEAMAPPYQAKTPDPANHAVGVAANANLSWVNGTGTTTIDLYFAQTYDSVSTSIAAAKKIDNVLATSYDPPWDLLANQQYFWKVVTRNAYGVTVSPVWDFTVTGAPLAGSYDIGGGNNNYPNFTTAVAALYGNGISDAVTFNVYGGDYNEQVKLRGAIPGASADDTVKFRDASGSARLRVTYLLPSDQGVIHDSAASYVIFDGIDIMVDQVHDSTYHPFVMKAGASNCIFRNATWRGSGTATSGVRYGIYIWGTACNNNLFDNLLIKRNNRAVYFSGSTTQRHTGNVFRNCTIDTTSVAFYLYYTRSTHIRDNDIVLNGGGSNNYGVDFNTHLSGDTVFIYRNKFHNLVATGSPAFIRAYGGTGTILNVFNNFFYDVQTTGTASPYVALYASTGGTTNFSFNSVYINDVASTGTVCGIYMSSSSAILNIRNNIFYSAESSASTYIFNGMSAGYVPATLDYNAYYNAPSNVNYQVYRVSSTGYATLAALQAATTYEDHGVEGNPGFYSASNLHIDSTYNRVSNIGLPITGIEDDIDRQARSVSNPDIGADEYTYLGAPADYAVTDFLNVTYLNPEFTLLHPRARVVNRGSAAQTDVPVVLFYSGTPQDTVFVSLGVDEVDTVDFDWTTPAAPQLGTLEAQSFLTGDTALSNDSVLFAVRIVGQPMHGTYDIGGGSNHYANFSAAITDLTLRTMDGAVIFDVYGTTYNDQMVMGPITGASSTNTITFQEHVGALDEPVKITASSGTAVVTLNGADYVTFDGIDIEATGTCTNALYIYNGADYNAIKNCAVTGANVSSTSYRGIYVWGGGNDYNTFDNLTMSGGGYGIDLYAASGAVDVGNEVKDCSITEGIYGVRTQYQRGGRVHDCDIQPGWAGAATAVYGLYVTSQTALDTVFCYNNKVHNIRTSGTYAATGIYTVANPARIYNNFVYDFQSTGTGPVYGLYAYGGASEFYFNNVYIGDVATTGGSQGMNGFYMATGTTVSATLKNNVFQIEEPTSACYAINRNAGTLVSDYNAVYSSGPGALYNMGRDGTTNYANLAAWQAATVYDDNSVEGKPGFFSPTNLHILATYSLLNGVGTPIGGIGFDIDNEARGGTPDIGADEYAYSTFDHDYAVIRFIGLLPLYTALTPYVIQVEVKNWGTNDETDVPVRLYYNNVQQDVELVSLTAGQLTNVNLDWTPPDVGYEIGALKAKAFCPSDGYPPDDSLTAAVTVIGGPMHGVYDLGGGDMDFTSFAEALTSLYLRGVDGETIFDVYGGTYNERVTLRNPITGANFSDRVIFRNHQSPLNDIVTLAPSGDTTAVVVVDSCDFVTFDGINVTCSNATYTGYWVDNDADYVTIKNAVIVGRDSSQTTARGIVVQHDLCDNVTIDGCTISNCMYGVMTYMGRSNTESADLEIKNCSISGGCYNIMLDNVPNARAHHNMLQPADGYSTTLTTQGVMVESQNTGDTVYVYANKIFNIRRFGRTASTELSGIHARPGAGAYAYVYNNMIWGFSTPDPRQKGVIAGITCGTGNVYAYHNSIRIPDLGLHADSLGVIAGINITSASPSAVTIMDNIMMVVEDDDSAYGIRRSSTSVLTSDYNCFYGNRVGYTGGATYATLANWQTLGYDAHSVAGDPGFMSASDLHIDSTYLLVNNAGLYVTDVQTDIDGDVRNDPPDIGADEYHGIVMPEVVDSLTIFPDAAAGDVLLRWTPSAEANSYKIYRGNVYGFVIDGTTYLDQTAGTTYTDVGILNTASARLYYVVIASTDHIAR
jgi:hypothetical protein